MKQPSFRVTIATLILASCIEQRHGGGWGPDETAEAKDVDQITLYDEISEQLDAIAEDDSENEVAAQKVFCGPGEACNALLHVDHSCPGRCITQPHKVLCKGEVHYGLCHYVFAQKRNQAVDIGGILVSPESVPAEAVVGQLVDIKISVANRTFAPINVPFSVKHMDNWEILTSNFADLKEISLGPLEAMELIAQMRPLSANVFHSSTETVGGPFVLLSLYIGEGLAEFYTVVFFSEDEPIECGGHYFPAQWCEDNVCGTLGAFYTQAQCCEGVFFPGAMCCNDSDCTAGACIDGKCVDQAPNGLLANNLPIGNQRVLLVLVDSWLEPSSDLCADRSKELPPWVQYEEATKYFEALVRARTGRDLVKFRWKVIGGFSSTDFIDDGNYVFGNYVERLEEYLTSKGCEPFAAFDKVVVASTLIDLLGFGGHALDRGRVAVGSVTNPYLLAHELAHTFGASDLYLDLGGRFQYVLDLMGNNLGGLGTPNDGVMWGEIGLDDLDRDGIIDLVQFAAFPEQLRVENISANITYKNTLEVTFSFSALESGLWKRVVVNNCSVEVIGFGALKACSENRRKKIFVFDEYEVDIAALKAKSTIEIRVSATETFTARDWSRKTLTFSETFVVPLGYLAGPQ